MPGALNEESHQAAIDFDLIAHPSNWLLLCFASLDKCRTWPETGLPRRTIRWQLKFLLGDCFSDAAHSLANRFRLVVGVDRPWPHLDSVCASIYLLA